MPQPPNLRRLVIKGSVPGGETMQHTFHVRDATPIGSAPLQDLANGVRDAWTRFLTVSTPSLASTAAILHTSVVYSDVTAYNLNETTGAATDSSLAVFGPTAKGTDTINPLPQEVAVCASLRTARPGRSRRGRMFLGGFTSATVTASGRMVSGHTQHLATALARFFDEVKDIGDTGPEATNWVPCIASNVLGESNDIVTVSVGDVFDVQRSRRASLIEARASASFD